MTRKFLLDHVKQLLKLQNKLFYTFVLRFFVDEIFQFDFFVLTTNYVTVCIMKHHKVDCNVDFLLRDDVRK